MYSSNDRFSFHEIRAISALEMFTKTEQDKAIDRILEKWQQNPLFVSVTAGTATFQGYVKDYVADNMGLGILKCWRLSHKPSSEFIENIYQLFNVPKTFLGIGNSAHYRLTSVASVMVILLNIFQVSIPWVLVGFMVFSGGIRELYTWPHASFVLFLLLAWVSAMCLILDSPFCDRRKLAEKLLSDAVELDEVIRKYRERQKQ